LRPSMVCHRPMIRTGLFPRLMGRICERLGYNRKTS
jgi:hypothetical protein